MLISLTVSRVRGESDAPHRYAFDQDEVLIGRDEAVEVRLPDAAVSLVHLRLQRRKAGLFAVDAGSTNGTRLDGRPLAAHVPAPLQPGSCLAVGPYVLRLEEPGKDALTLPEDTARLARQMVLEVLGVAPALHPSLEVGSGPGQGQRLELPPGPPLLVGRGEECALRLVDSDASRRHLELSRQGERVLVRDLGSKNGLQRNGERADGPCLLRDGDELLVGSTLLRFSDPAGRFLGELSAGADAHASPSPGASPPPGASPSPGASPAPGVSPSPPPRSSPPSPAARPAPRGGALSLVVLVGAGLLLAAGVVVLIYVLL